MDYPIIHMIWNRITWIPLPNRWQNSMDWFLLDQKNRFPMDFLTQIVRSSHWKGHPIGNHPARKESIYKWNLEIAKLSISPKTWKGIKLFPIHLTHPVFLEGTCTRTSSHWLRCLQWRPCEKVPPARRCHARCWLIFPWKSKISWIYPIYHDIYIYICFNIYIYTHT